MDSIYQSCAKPVGPASGFDAQVALLSKDFTASWEMSLPSSHAMITWGQEYTALGYWNLFDLDVFYLTNDAYTEDQVNLTT